MFVGRGISSAIVGVGVFNRLGVGLREVGVGAPQSKSVLHWKAASHGPHTGTHLLLIRRHDP